MIRENFSLLGGNSKHHWVVMPRVFVHILGGEVKDCSIYLLFLFYYYFPTTVLHHFCCLSPLN